MGGGIGVPPILELAKQLNCEKQIVVGYRDEHTFLREQFEANGFRYYINNNSEAIITQYVGGDENIVVPEKIGANYPVTALGDFCFAVCYYDGFESHSNHLVKSVVLPDTINQIGICAFAGNLSLESINIPLSLSVIPQNCFFRCISLDNITIPDNVEIIENGAFTNCENLKNITIPEKISEIKDNTFNLTMHVYICELISGNPELLVHTESTWCSKDELKELITNKPYLNQIISG